MVTSAASPRAYSAAIQPNAAMMNWLMGAKTNWPRLPPALMKPDAKALFSGGRRCAVAPMRMEKLPAPAPAANSTPMLRMSIHSLETTVVSPAPAASIRAPAMSTELGPNRSAMAPKMG